MATRFSENIYLFLQVRSLAILPPTHTQGVQNLRLDKRFSITPGERIADKAESAV
jgi:hypothetical protein